MSNIYSGIAWYYGDNDLKAFAFDLNAACVTCRTDMGFHMTCNTDMDSRVTCSIKYVELHVLHGFVIDSHMFA